MRIAFLCCAFFFAAVHCGAQPDAGYYGPYSFESGAVKTIFSDTALVRAMPGGAVEDTLYAFADVRVSRRMPELLTVGRKTAPWYEVQYTTHGAKRSGCMWGGAFALGAAARDGVEFLFNVLSYPQRAAFSGEDEPDGSGHNTCAIKARTGVGPVQQCLFNISRESASFLDTSRDEDGKVYYPRFGTARSLPGGARFLVHFYMSGEACGIPSYQLSAAWDGARLIRMPMLEGNADAGVWSYEEEYVYPEMKGGKAGHLLVRGTSEEYEDVDGRTEPKLIKRTVTMQPYRWAQGAFVSVGNKK